MNILEQFEKAQEESKNLKERPDNQTLLRLYALFKQGSVGDAPESGPANPFDIVGKAKYDAWSSLRGTPKEKAQEDYIALVNQLKTSA